MNLTVNTKKVADGQTVTLLVNGAPADVASATVSENSATFPDWRPTATGTYSLAVRYGGSDTVAETTSAPVNVVVDKITTSVALQVGSPTHTGTPVPLTATTTGIPDGEQVEFHVEGMEPEGVNVVGGTAYYNGWIPAAEGDYNVSVRYAGTATRASAATLGQMVNVSTPVQATSTTLDVDPLPIAERSTRLTATVTGGRDGDSVRFENNGAHLGTVQLNGGVATYDWAVPFGQAAQDYSLTAHYLGSTGYGTSASVAETGTIGKRIATVSEVTATPATVAVDTEVNLRATITGGQQGAQVQFRDAQDQLLCQVQLGTGSTASCNWTPRATGVFNVIAHYPGTTTTTEASSPSATGITVAPKQSSIELTGPTSVSVGNAETYTATVNGIANDENVTFAIEGEQDRTVQVANGQAAIQWSPSATGTYEIRASYAGSGTVNSSTSDVLTVEVGLAPTQTSTVTASSEPVTGAPVTLSATVTGGTLGTDVVFRDGTNHLCTAQVGADGTATCEWIPDQIGAVNVAAHYAGNHATAASQSSNPTTVTVGQGTVAMPGDLVVTPSAPDAGQSVIVSGTAPAGATVKVYTTDYAQQCSATATAAGTFTCDLGPLPAGTTTISAAATLNDVPSQIATTTVTVDKVTPVLTLTGPASVKPGQTVTLDLVTKGIADGQSVAILVNDE
ncbi:Ig-like domain-containing protein, partial [Dietzia sp. NPDC055343]